jgi:bacteriophage exclusion system BrxC/D-like protein
VFAKAVIRRLRAGIVPDTVLEPLSVGYGSLASLVAERIEALRSRRPVAPLFVSGEWGRGKSHFLSFARAMASRRGLVVSAVSLNARSAPLNYPQRLYPLVVANLKDGRDERGLRALLPGWLRDAATRRRLLDFSELSSAGDLGSTLRELDSMYGKDDGFVLDGEWAWAPFLGGDLSWADYPYKRVQALARLQSLTRMLRYGGFGSLVVTFDEVETIDQLWSVRSRLVAYDVLGQLVSMDGLWCLFGITDRFRRTVDADIGRGVTDWANASTTARRFLTAWQRNAFETVEPPAIDRQLGRALATRVAKLYSGAYAADEATDDFINSCAEEWARNPARDPRRLIRLVVHRLDCRRAGDGATTRQPTSTTLVSGRPSMTVEDVEVEFDRLVRSVPDLSSREPGKFRPLKDWLGQILGIPSDKVSVKYLGTPNNLKNRLTESSGQGPEVTIALTSPQEVARVVRTARQLVGIDKPLKAVVVATHGSAQRWSLVWCIDATTTRTASRLREFFPSMKIE